MVEVAVVEVAVVEVAMIEAAEVEAENLAHEPTESYKDQICAGYWVPVDGHFAIVN
jgi:hypothetical protein